MSSARIDVARDGRIVTVRLDGPERHNVLDRDGWEHLASTVNGLASDDIGCLVVRGAGQRAFSAGSDIRGFDTQRDVPADVRRYSDAIASALGALQESPHPTLAVIEGLCVGGGLEIAAACDLRVCGASSRFGAPIARLGLTMAYEELAPLLSLLGRGVLLDLLLTGALIDARRALEVGLVQRVFEDDEVEASGHALARSVAGGASRVHTWHKKFLRRLQDPRPLDEAERAEALEAFGTEDYREGRAAFLEKRDPRFRGR